MKKIYMFIYTRTCALVEHNIERKYEYTYKQQVTAMAIKQKDKELRK